MVAFGLIVAAAAHAMFNVAAFAFPPISLVLAVAGVSWTLSRLSWSQRVSPFRYKRNYPQIECPTCHQHIRVTGSYCRFCGTPARAVKTPLICGHCLTRNRSDSSYCAYCGDQFLT